MFYLIVAFCIVLLIINFDKLKAYFAVPIDTASDALKKAQDNTKNAVSQAASTASDAVSNTSNVHSCIEQATDNIVLATNSITQATAISKQVTQLINDVVDAMVVENSAIQTAQNSVSATLTGVEPQITALTRAQLSLQQYMQQANNILQLFTKIKVALPSATLKSNRVIVLGAQIQSIKMIINSINSNIIQKNTFDDATSVMLKQLIANNDALMLQVTQNASYNDVRSSIQTITDLNTTSSLKLNYISPERLNQNIADVNSINSQINTVIVLYNTIKTNNAISYQLPINQYKDAITQSNAFIQRISTNMMYVQTQSQLAKDGCANAIDAKSIDIKLQNAASIHSAVSKQLITTSKMLVDLNNILVYSTSVQTPATKLLADTRQGLKSIVDQAAKLPDMSNDVYTRVGKRVEDISNNTQNITQMASELTVGLDACTILSQLYEDYEQLLFTISLNARKLLQQIAFIATKSAITQVSTGINLLLTPDGVISAVLLFGGANNAINVINVGFTHYQLIPDIINSGSNTMMSPSVGPSTDVPLIQPTGAGIQQTTAQQQAQQAAAQQVAVQAAQQHAAEQAVVQAQQAAVQQAQQQAVREAQQAAQQAARQAAAQQEAV